MFEAFTEAVIEMREEEALAFAQEFLASNGDPLELLEACRQAMEEVGRRFENQQYFIPELMLGGEILRQVSELVKPVLAQEAPRERLGVVILGTVEGDIHDIGKDIVAFMLDINGFEVVDLGVDVPPVRFIEALEAHNAHMLALSGFLTLAFDPMKFTIAALTEAGMHDRVRVMIGGGPINEQVQTYTGADAWGADASAAVRLAREWTTEV